MDPFDLRTGAPRPDCAYPPGEVFEVRGDETPDAICSKMDYAICYHRWGNRNLHRGYGGSFRKWLATPEKDLAPYGSWGNGSAMRVSPVGFAFKTVDDVLDAA